jgi:thiamine-monophosphate kinase
MGDEFSRIAKYFAPLAAPAGLGLQDDAAVFTPPPGREIVLTVDQMLEGIHFLPGDPPGLIAQKLLRRNFSDLAAMGATPLGYLLTIALPPGTSEDWLAGFANGLALDQDIFGAKLFGGDSSSSLAQKSFCVTMLGHVAPGQALRRNGARPGDEIWVTGTIGDAAIGLQGRLGKLQNVPAFLIARSQLPGPRIGLKLAGIVNAAIDISDGLVQDLAHICKASGVAAHINADLVPRSPEAAAYGNEFLECRLTDGDDYELLVAVPPDNAQALRKACGALQLTRIGVFSEGPPNVEIHDAIGQKITFLKHGWQHF